MRAERFPYADGRAVIDAFLAGRATSAETDTLVYRPGPRTLVFKEDARVDAAIAFVDTAGALYLLTPLSPWVAAQIVRVMNYICERLGLPEQVVREVGEPIISMGEASPRRVRYFLNDREILLSQPFELLGALGLRAWRAAQEASS